MSTAYYALFRSLSQEAADLFVGRSAAVRGNDAWCRVARALNHGLAKQACERVVKDTSWSVDARTIANTFVQLQAQRLSADYDPNSRYTRAQAIALVREADDAVDRLATMPATERRAFLVFLLFPGR